jgi:iron(III) transport system substrate-binding protein
MKRALCFVFLVVGGTAGSATAAPSPDEWDRVLAAARREGQVSVMGPVGTDTRDALTIPFEKAYGIRVDYFGSTGGQQATRLAMERRAGKYLWDIFIGGTTTGLTSLIPLGAFDRMDPALILPEVKDAKFWRGGGIEFVDPGRQMVVMTPTHRVTLVVNTTLLSPTALKSYKDLLDPKWKGKIVIQDPQLAGSSQATFTFFYLHPELGVNYIRALARQSMLVLRDPAQALQMTGQGKHPIHLGPRDSILMDAIRRGVPLAIVEPTHLKEGSDVSSGAGNAALFNRPSHPNAAKVFINWLLSRDGQQHYGRALGYVSKRLDVPNDYAEPWRVPQPGAINTYDQKAIDVKDDLIALLQETFGR